MAKTARLELRVEPGMLERIDAARGDVSRTRWVERALESALGHEASRTSAVKRTDGPAAPPVSSRAPVAKALEARDAVRARNASKQAPSLRDTWGR